MADRRSSAATAGVGYTLVATGGALRGHAVNDAHTAIGAERRLKPPAGAVYAAHQLRVPGRAKLLRRFGLGTALVTLGAPAAAKGTYDLIRGPRHQAEVVKRRTPLVAEGVTGTGEALRDKADSLRSGAPARTRVVPIVAGGAGALTGTLITHRILDALARRGRAVHPTGRAALTAVAAVPSALATLPLSRRLTRRSGYQVTPTGVHKAALKQVFQQVPPAFPVPTPNLVPVVTRRVRYSQQLADTGVQRTRQLQAKSTRAVQDSLVAKSWQPKQYDPPDYRGRHTPVGRQRAAIYSAGAIPVGLGAVAAAKVAGAYAPPGRERRTSARQVAAGPLLGTAAGVVAAHQTARLSETSPAVADATEQIHRGLQRAAGAVKGRLPERTPSPRMAVAAARAERVKGAVKASRALRPFFGTPQRAIASGVGYALVKPLVGQAGSSWAMHRNQLDQTRYNSHHPIVKFQAGPMDQNARDKMARRKRFQARTSVITGLTGLSALALLAAAKHPRLRPHAAKLEHHRNSLLAVGAGVGGAGALNFAGIQRREAVEESKPRIQVSQKVLVDAARRNQSRTDVIKFDQVRTDMHQREARRLVRQYGGLRGPLPPGLSRDERMRAWEARYVAAGGHKVHRWQRRAEAAEVTRNAGLVAGVASGAAWLAAGSPRGRAAGRAVGRAIPKVAHISHQGVKRVAERTAVGAATIGASAELAGEYARHRRASYTSAPGGVAASALTRMRAYTPGDPP